MIIIYSLFFSNRPDVDKTLVKLTNNEKMDENVMIEAM